MNKQDLLTRIDAVVTKGKATLDSVETQPGGILKNSRTTGTNPEHRWVKADIAGKFRTSGLTLLQSLYGTEHQIYTDFESGTRGMRTLEAYRAPVALIETVREEVDAGWLEDTRALIAGDIFANILEMAEYLLSESYKDAAAVLIGGSLEGHLRNLAPRHNVDTHYLDKAGISRPKKAETLNQDLYKADAYKLGDQKQVTAWLDIRNNAAHAHYDAYTRDEVKLMLQGVQNFIIRIPI